MKAEILAQFSCDVLGLLVDQALRGVVLAGLVAFVLRVLRVRSSSAQRVAFTFVLFAAMVLPLFTWLVPPISIRVPIRQMESSVAFVISNAAEPKGPTSATLRPLPGVTKRLDGIAGHPTTEKEPGLLKRGWKYISVPWPILGLAAYLMALTALMARLAFGLAVTRRLREAAGPIRDGHAFQLFQHCAHKLRVGWAPLLAESSFVSVPLTFGVLRPVIVIPSDWRRWQETKLAAVMAHELSHVKRRDPLIQRLATLYRNVYWFSPLGWWLERRLADLAEQASDEEAMSMGTEPTYYAEVLMSFIQEKNSLGRVNWQGVWITWGKRAVSRIERVLSLGERSGGGLKKSLLVVTIAGVVPVAYLAAAMQPRFAVMPAPTGQTLRQSSPEIPPPEASAVARVSPSSAQRGSTMTQRSGSNVHRSPNIVSAMWLATTIEDDYDDRTFHSSRNGTNFAVVSGASVMTNGSEADRSKVNSLRKKISGDFIWFIQNGNEYVIQDAAMVKTAIQLYAPTEQLARQQEQLGKQQEQLGKQQEALGNQMERTRVDMPDDLLEKLEELKAEIQKLGASANMEDLGRLQGELGNLQGRLGELQGKAGAEQGRLGQQQGVLGAKQAELGHRQGELGREQARVAHEAERRVQDIITKAVANGSAKRVD